MTPFLKREGDKLNKNNKKHREGELDAFYFDKLPQRCKEIDVLTLAFYAIGLPQKSIGPLTGGILFFVWMWLGGKWW